MNRRVATASGNVRPVRVLFVGLLALLSSLALAQTSTDSDPISTVRPRMTDTTRIVPKDNLQIEAGLDIGFDGYHDGRRDTFGETLVRYGLAPRLELRIGLPSYTNWRTINLFDGFGDVSVSASYLLGRLGAAHFALSPRLTLPTGARYPHVEHPAPSAFVTGEAPIGKGFSVASTVGYSHVEYDYPFLTDRNRFDALQATFAVERALRGNRASVFTEFSGSYINGFLPNQAVNFGGRLRLSHDSQVDVRLTVPIDDGNRQSAVGLGYAVRF